MRILGIDPGSRFTGYGVIEKQGQKLVHIASGRINASSTDLSFGARLDTIYSGIIKIIDELEPTAAGVETPFAAKNIQSTIKLSQARGVALLALEHRQISPAEYSPAEIKNTVTGHGRASKASIDIMVKRLLNIDPDAKISEDAADALAIAICHCQVLAFQQKLART